LLKIDKFFIIIFTILLIVFSCSKGGIESDNKVVGNQVKVDSIEYWIKKSKLTSILDEDKYNYLKKAYDLNKLVNNDSVRGVKLIELSSEAKKIKDSVFYRKLINEIILYSQKYNDTLGLAKTYWNDGYFYYHQGDLNSAYTNYFKAYKYYKLVNNQYYSSKMLFNMAFILARVKSFVECEEKLFLTIRNVKPLSKHKLLYRCYNLLGNIYKELDLYEDSFKYHNMALDELNKFEDKSTYKIGVYNNIGLTYQKQGKFNEAAYYFEKGLDSDSLLYKNIGLFSRLKDNLTYTKFLQGERLSIVDDFLYSLKLRDSVNNASGVLISSIHLSEYFLKTKDTVNALLYANKANEIAVEVNNNRDLLSSLKLLSKADIKNSKKHLDSYIELSESIDKTERDSRNKFARIRFETDEYIEENNRLSLQRILIVVTALALIGVLLLLYFIKIQRSKNKELELRSEQQSANEEIYQLMLNQHIKLDEGRIKERNRISEELHDGILGKIFGIRLGLGFLDLKENSIDNSKFDSYIDELQAIEKEIRLISHDLKNETLTTNVDYFQVIKNLITSQCNVNDLEYDILQGDDINWSQMNDELKVNCYRILQEALQNIFKHANANTVKVSFMLEESRFKLIITDDGVGFDDSIEVKGIGFRNIASRVNKLNGTFVIESYPNKGTELKISCPIDNE
jgi:signal transduction histidine kinase